MDRWCTHCNTYQSARVCERCKKATEELVVLTAPGKPKVRCYCRAPFEGLRFVNESGLPFMMGYEGKLQGEVLTVDILIDAAEGAKVITLGEAPSTLAKPLRCPHCGREMLLARAINRTRFPVKTELELTSRPDGGVVMVVRSTKGEVTHGN